MLVGLVKGMWQVTVWQEISSKAKKGLFTRAM